MFGIPTDHLQGCCCCLGFSLALGYRSVFSPGLSWLPYMGGVNLFHVLQHWFWKHADLFSNWVIHWPRIQQVSLFLSNPTHPLLLRGVFSSAWGLFISFYCFIWYWHTHCHSAFLFPRPTIWLLFRWKGCIGSMLFADGGWNYVPCYVTDLENCILWVGRACAPPQPTPQCLGLT